MKKQAKIRKQRRRRAKSRNYAALAEAFAEFARAGSERGPGVVTVIVSGDRENEMAQANERYATLERRAKYRNRKGRRAHRRLVEVASGDRWFP